MLKQTELKKETAEKYIGKKFGKLLVLSFSRFITECNGKRRNAAVNVKCDCGTEREVLIRRIAHGQVSCGCSSNSHWGMSSEIKEKLGIGANKSLYHIYKRNALKRNLEFSITIDEFRELIKQNCTYCGTEPKNIKRYKRSNKNTLYETLIYSGVDRVDNTKGYFLENCTPCCAHCNKMKAVLTIEEFKEHIIKVYTHYVQKH